MNKRILVVEDESSIQQIVKTFLESAGYQVDTADDGMEALTQFGKANYDLVILDILMPKVDGYTVCEMLRKSSSVPIIMLTALDEEADEVRAFDLKADDFITKPFSPTLLVRRVEAVLRRSTPQTDQRLLTYGEVTMDLEGYRVLVSGQEVSLTSREFDILRLLLENRGRVITRQTLLNQVWDYDYIGDEKIINTHIKNIRKKLNLDFIETIRGVGYRVD